MHTIATVQTIDVSFNLNSKIISLLVSKELRVDRLCMIESWLDCVALDLRADSLNS